MSSKTLIFGFSPVSERLIDRDVSLADAVTNFWSPENSEKIRQKYEWRYDDEENRTSPKLQNLGISKKLTENITGPNGHKNHQKQAPHLSR